MAYLLNIETATTVCSVSLSLNGELISSRELDEGYSHAENLHVFIREILEETGITTRDLQGIAVSRGPGSYTGLRIGTSAAKGLAYSLNIPIISIDTLKIMAISAYSIFKDAHLYCPMLDARRMEVYTATYNSSIELIKPVDALIIDDASGIKWNNGKVCFFGNGMEKCRSILSSNPEAIFLRDVHPSAKMMCALSQAKFDSGSFEDTAYFEPLYLKDFMVHKKKPVTKVGK